MPLKTWLRALSCAAVGIAAAACNGGNAEGDAGPSDATVPPSDGEPKICTEFTEAGAPCSLASPVRCFPECDSGGCYCTQTPSGARWTCQTDLSCVPDCAPINDGCSPLPTGDDGAGDDGGGDDGGGAAEGGDGGAGGDAADAGPGDAGADAPSG